MLQVIYLLAVGSALVIGSIMFLLLFNLKLPQKPVISFVKWKWFDITILFLFITILFNLHENSGRSPIIFILFAIISGIIGVSIFLDSTNEQKVRTILYILGLSTIIISSIYYTQLSLTGVDAGIHAAMNEKLAESGLLDSLWYHEKYFPIMHISVASLMIVSGIGIKEATFFSVVFSLIISTICVYLLCNILFSDRRIGLFALLFLNVTEWLIFWGYSPTTTTYGVALYFFIIYILIKKYQYTGIHWTLLIITLIITMIFNHPMTSFILLCTLIAFSITQLLSKYLFRDTICIKSMSNIHIFTIFTALVMIFHWFYALYLSDPMFDTLLRFLQSSVESQFGVASRPETIASIQATLPSAIERILDVAGLTMLLILYCVGLLFLLSNKNRGFPQFLLVFVSVVLFSIIFGIPFFGLKNFLSERWFAFVYFFVVIISAYALIEILNYLHKFKYQILSILIVVATMTFFFTASTVCNQDAPLWLQESTRPYSLAPLTVSEDIGYKTLTKYSNEIMDNHIALQEDSIFQRGDTIFIWKEYMNNRPVRLFRNIDTDMQYDTTRYYNKVLGQEYYKKFLLENKIYSNEYIIAFLPRA